MNCTMTSMLASRVNAVHSFSMMGTQVESGIQLELHFNLWDLRGKRAFCLGNALVLGGGRAGSTIEGCRIMQAL